MTEAQQLLRRLAENHEASLRTVLAPSAARDSVGRALDHRTRLLVRLAALLVVGAPTASLQWAIELASAAGVDDDEVIGALAATGSIAGGAQLVANAPAVALSLGFDVEPPWPDEA